MDGDAIKGILLFALVGAVLTAGVFAIGRYDQQKWDKFAAEHECKVVEKMPGYWINGTDSKGKSTSSWVHARTAWLCNDGVKHWR